MNILDYQSVAVLNAVNEALYDITQLQNFRKNFEKKHNCKYLCMKKDNLENTYLEFLNDKSLEVFLLKYS